MKQKRNHLLPAEISIWYTSSRIVRARLCLRVKGYMVSQDSVSGIKYILELPDEPGPRTINT